GHCSVHQMFKPAHVAQFRDRFPGIKILVHPECMMSVVDAADLVGSTEFILKTIAEAPAGSTWAVGTELHLVNRLAAEHPRPARRCEGPRRGGSAAVRGGCLVARESRVPPPPSGVVAREPGEGDAAQQGEAPRRNRSLGTRSAGADARGPLSRPTEPSRRLVA